MRYKPPAVADGSPEVSVVIPSWNGRDLLAACLTSLQQVLQQLVLEVIVVDNASADGSVELVRDKFSDVRLVCNPTNEGFARACNRGAAMARAPFVLVLNSDARLEAQALARLLELARSQPRAGVVGPQLRNEDGSFQGSHAAFPTLWQETMVLTGAGRLIHGPAYPSRGPEEERGAQRVDWVGGACLLVRGQAFAAVGGFDEAYFMYAEETDLCYRLRQAGWEVWYEPAAVVVHVGGGSSAGLGPQREVILYRSRLRFHQRHRAPAAAKLLRWMILSSTLLKIGVHGLLRRLSGGRVGRQVVSLRALRAELR
jgi:GT2 family glycosyltransferase